MHHRSQSDGRQVRKLRAAPSPTPPGTTPKSPVGTFCPAYSCSDESDEEQVRETSKFPLLQSTKLSYFSEFLPRGEQQIHSNHQRSRQVEIFGSGHGDGWLSERHP
jgi:hypothetical protein